MATKKDPKIMASAARAILDSGVKYKTDDGSYVVLHALKLGTILTICQRVADAGLTSETLEEERKDAVKFVGKYGHLMPECIAIAVINDREKLTEEEIQAKALIYTDKLTNFQLYELFIQVLNLSGIEAFTNTISLLTTMTEKQLSPRNQGS
jgi:hypothetical protein